MGDLRNPAPQIAEVHGLNPAMWGANRPRQQTKGEAAEARRPRPRRRPKALPHKKQKRFPSAGLLSPGRFRRWAPNLGSPPFAPLPPLIMQVRHPSPVQTRRRPANATAQNPDHTTLYFPNPKLPPPNRRPGGMVIYHPVAFAPVQTPSQPKWKIETTVCHAQAANRVSVQHPSKNHLDIRPAPSRGVGPPSFFAPERRLGVGRFTAPHPPSR